jgi:hypothetical protein
LACNPTMMQVVKVLALIAMVIGITQLIMKSKASKRGRGGYENRVAEYQIFKI